jgi:hypothetical protein
MDNPLKMRRERAMWHSGLKNWKEIIWYGWVVGGALVVVNASIVFFLALRAFQSFGAYELVLNDAPSERIRETASC